MRRQRPDSICKSIQYQNNWKEAACNYMHNMVIFGEEIFVNYIENVSNLEHKCKRKVNCEHGKIKARSPISSLEIHID